MGGIGLVVGGMDGGLSLEFLAKAEVDFECFSIDCVVGELY